MILEQAMVLSVEPESVLLQARQRSACDSCRAQSGCGQAVLGRLLGQEQSVRASLPLGMNGKVRAGDLVTVAVPAHSVVLGSLFLYLVPVVGLLAGALGASGLGLSEGVTAVSALTGLVAGGLLVRLASPLLSQRLNMRPFLVAEADLASGPGSFSDADGPRGPWPREA